MEGGRIVGLQVNYAVGLGGVYMPFFFVLRAPSPACLLHPLILRHCHKAPFIAFALLPVVSAQTIDCILWPYKQIRQK